MIIRFASNAIYVFNWEIIRRMIKWSLLSCEDFIEANCL